MTTTATNKTGRCNRTDAQVRALVESGLNGNAQAQEDLYELAAGRFRSFAGRQFEDQNTVDEVLSDTLINAWNQLNNSAKPSFESIRSFEGWFVRIGRCRVIDRIRKQGRDRHVFPEEFEEPVHEDPDFINWADCLLKLKRHLKDSDVQIILKRAEGMTGKEIASEMEVSDIDVKTALTRIRKQLSDWRMTDV